EEIDDEYILVFKDSDLKMIEKVVKESIDNSDDRLHVKLQQWQLRNIEKLIHGVNYPTKENIQSLLNVSSVFYFEGQNKNQDLLSDHEFSELKSHMMSKFEFIGITEEIKQFVADNKRKFKMDSIDEIQQIIIKEHGKCQSNLINRTFFKLLDEYVPWDSTSNLEKSPEPMISVQSKPSKERRGGHNGRIPDFMLHNQDGTKTSIFTEITGPCKQNCKIKPYWDIYRAGIHVKDAIDSDIRKNKNLTPNETKKIIILINSFNLCAQSAVCEGYDRTG
ncbi:7811_t:CDS:2, partial [Entrophospora sp. SA101]